MYYFFIIDKMSLRLDKMVSQTRILSVGLGLETHGLDQCFPNTEVCRENFMF